MIKGIQYTTSILTFQMFSRREIHTSENEFLMEIYH